MAKILFQLATLLFLPAAHNANPMTSLIVSPISIDHKVALSEALGVLGTSIRGGYVLFGIDMRSVPEPQVELSIGEATPLGVALAQIVGQARGYGYQSVSEHVIEVYALQESRDPADMLNIRVEKFSLQNVAAMNILANPPRYIPELKEYQLKGKTVQACGSIGPGLGSDGPGISLDLHNVTIRDILNAVTEADANVVEHVTLHDLPVGWVHKLEPDQEGHAVDTWSFLSPVPHDWETYSHKGDLGD
jgi:hypothetical protein